MAIGVGAAAELGRATQQGAHPTDRELGACWLLAVALCMGGGRREREPNDNIDMNGRSSASPPPSGDGSTLHQASMSRRNVVTNQGYESSLAAQLDQDRWPNNWDRVIPRWRTSLSRPSLMLAYDHERRGGPRESESSSTAGESYQSSFPPWMRPALTGTQDVRERQLEALESSYNHPIAPPVVRGRGDPFHDGRFRLDTPIRLRQQRSSPSRYMTDYGDEIDRGLGESDCEDMRPDRRLAIELALHGSDESDSDSEKFLKDEAEANVVTDSLSQTSPPSSLDLSSDGIEPSEPISAQVPSAHPPVAEQEVEVPVSQQRVFKSELPLPTGKPKECDDSTQLKSSGDEKSPNSCVICLEKPSQESLASIDGCDHHFCFECIAQWAEHENSCPLCKNRFAKIVRLQPSKKRKVGDGEDTQDTKRVKHKDQRGDLQASLDNVAGMFGKSRPPCPAAFIPASHICTQRVCEAVDGGPLLPGLFYFPPPQFKGIHQSLFDSPWRLHVPIRKKPLVKERAPSTKSSVPRSSIVCVSRLREGLRLDRSLALPTQVRGEECNYRQNPCLKTTTTRGTMIWRKISSCLLRLISNDFIGNLRVQAQQTVVGLFTTQRT